MGDVFDRAKETTTTAGSGNITLAGTSQGYRTLFAAAGLNWEFYYCIAHQTADEWEVGEGYLSGSTTLVRDLVLSSSNSGSAVNFSAGTKDVFITAPAYEFQTKGHVYARMMNLVFP